MALPRFQTDVDNISALADRPNDVNGLTAAELKARFDKAGDDIKSWINTSLIPYLEGTNAASSIGITAIPGLEATNVQAALAELKLGVEDAIEYASGNRRSPAFSITGGTYAYKEQAVAGSDQNNWELALLSGTNAKITFARTTGPIDVFLIGGGAPGSGGSFSENGATGADGGRSGRRVTRLNMEIEEGVSYSFTVGAPGKVTKIFGIQSPDGTYTEGGSGGVAEVLGQSAHVVQATSGGDGEYAFGDANCLLFPGRKYGAGGGGGGASVSKNVIIGMDQQGNPVYRVVSTNTPGAYGGTTGGGTGSSNAAISATSGADNTGSGGGGAFFAASEYTSASSANGKGGSGIIIIRNARG